MITRPRYLAQVSAALQRSPVTALLGPRQCGKTTLARMLAEQREAHYFDLESPMDRQRLQNPELLLGALSGLVILDEIQLAPELFGVLRVLADRPGQAARYLILGSASPQIIRKVSETLAGRIEFIDLTGFDLTEIPPKDGDRLWLRGGFPRSFLADSETDSLAWREGFIRTFLERDIPQLGISIPATAMRRFWTMLAHLHGQTWNASELGRSMGLSDKTVRHYLDILSGTYMVRQLQPWHENLKKRQVKTPKVYLRDSGLLHSLLSIGSRHDLLGHPRLGASWEGFTLEQVLCVLRPVEAYFWATQGGAELDLLFFSGGQRFGVECKFNEAPKVTKSMHSALADLGLRHLWVVYPGGVRYRAHEKITILPLTEIATLPEEITID
ncbi:ATP-binding protein [Geobacter sp.]|uniref:ATP-binding protein n=1 Tax=Geobacter sp. TaxID=46610 RepID=UPI002636778F|nr:ATP-binding protein [Geobacter sp.]